MHISDGALSTAVTVVTSVAAAGVLAYSLKGTKNEEIPNIALMTSVFFVGSVIHIPIGPTSLHLLLTGFIGLIAGRRAPIAISIALLLQLFLFQFGGLTSLGANILSAGLPAMILGMFLRRFLHRPKAKPLLIGAIAGSAAVLFTVVLLTVILIQSHMQFGMGPFSTVRVLAVAHIPLFFVEAVLTAVAVQFIAKIRPEFFGRTVMPVKEVKQR